jgi:hypothetical protein
MYQRAEPSGGGGGVFESSKERSRGTNKVDGGDDATGRSNYVHTYSLRKLKLRPTHLAPMPSRVATTKDQQALTGTG